MIPPISPQGECSKSSSVDHEPTVEECRARFLGGEDPLLESLEVTTPERDSAVGSDMDLNKIRCIRVSFELGEGGGKPEVISWAKTKHFDHSFADAGR